MNSSSKSTLAKLLAKENITVQYGNHRTASFDVEGRVLRLPLWKYENKGLLDMLVGHEVGHALFTPVEGWHDCEEQIPGIPRAFVNVVEDIRIEKLIMRQYPGLVRSFKQGYTYLYEEDFFEIKGDDISKRPFMDRLNIKAKLRDLVEVPFNSIEQMFVDLAMQVETWEDVLNVCRQLLEFSEEQNNAEQLQASMGDSSQDQNSNGETTSADSGSEDDGDDTDSSNQISGSTSDEPSDEDGTQESGSNNNDTREQAEDNSKQLGGSEGSRDLASNNPTDHTQVSSDDAFRRNEDRLLDVDSSGYQRRVINRINDLQMKDMIVDYKDIMAARLERMSDPAYKDWFDYTTNLAEENPDEAYKNFVNETKRTVGVMAKEFEMRKAAYQYSRAKTARSGSLDVNKLHSYKYNDDIFLRVTNLADAKSHGMIMTIDFSGSMSGVIDSVIKQVLNLAMFCKKVSIPFDVYGFTNRHHNERTRSYPVLGKGDIDHRDVRMTHLLSSQMSKSDYETCYRHMFMQSLYGYYQSPYTSRLEGMGGTPLNEVLMVLPKLISEFKNRTGVQKVANVLLTDGEAQQVHIAGYYDDEGEVPTNRGVSIDMGNEIVSVDYYRDLTAKLLSRINKMAGVTNIGYFLAEGNYGFNGAVGKATGSWDHDVFRDARRQATKQKFISYDNVLGYDRYFILKADRRTLNTDTEDFEVRDNAKKGEIARAFKKYANSKKGNRILATQFAEMVA